MAHVPCTAIATRLRRVGFRSDGRLPIEAWTATRSRKSLCLAQEPVVWKQGTEAMKINDVDVRLMNPQYRVDAPSAGGGTAPRTSDIRPDPRVVDLDGVPTPLSGVDRPRQAAESSGTPTIDVVV